VVSMGRRAGVLAVIALSLFALTCAYRFMTMGGRLGGFDNDDFVVLLHRLTSNGDQATAPAMSPR
jgi:hypothetical protein